MNKKIFTKKGQELIEVKETLLNPNTSNAIRSITISAIKDGKLLKDKDESEMLISEDISLDEYVEYLIKNNMHVNKSGKSKALSDVVTKVDRALSFAGLKYFTTKEYEGKVAVVHKIGINDLYLMRHFMLTKDEYSNIKDIELPGFFKSYASIRLDAFYKTFKKKVGVGKYSSFELVVSDFYYDEDKDIYNRDIMFLLDDNIACLSDTPLSNSTILNIKTLFSEMRSLEKDFF